MPYSSGVSHPVAPLLHFYAKVWINYLCFKRDDCISNRIGLKLYSRHKIFEIHVNSTLTNILSLLTNLEVEWQLPWREQYSGGEGVSLLQPSGESRYHEGFSTPSSLPRKNEKVLGCAPLSRTHWHAQHGSLAPWEFSQQHPEIGGGQFCNNQS